MDLSLTCCGAQHSLPLLVPPVTFWTLAVTKTPAGQNPAAAEPTQQSRLFTAPGSTSAIPNRCTRDNFPCQMITI